MNTITAHARPLPRRGLRFWAGILTALGALAVLVSLGVWQLERLRWKEALIATVEASVHAAPVPLAGIENDRAAGSNIDYRPVVAVGRFLHAYERAFLTTLDGQSGWNIFTPLLLDDGRTAVFVNRGFVPYARKDPATRAAGQMEGKLIVNGLARAAPTEKSGYFIPDNAPAKNQFFWRSLPDMTAGVVLPAGAAFVPFYIDEGPGPAIDGWPVGGTTIIDIPNDHLQYAITWFGLAAVLAGMLGVVGVRRMRGSTTA